MYASLFSRYNANVLAAPADHWTLRRRTLRFGRRPLLMGIINVTPDSFSDGGAFLDPAAAIAQGLELVAQGAGILDVGGESTRPGAPQVGMEEELRRVLPVVKGLCARSTAPISIDTSKAAVAEAAIDAGAEIVNDVTGLQGDPAMISVAARSGAAVCAMHMLGTPQTMQINPTYEDVVEEVFQFLRGRRDALVAAGIAEDRVALDPGIGFGKTADHNLQLLSRALRFHALGCPVLVGHSRKRFIGHVLDDPKADPLAGTIGVALSLARQGVQVIRVHDVGAVHQALMLFEASGGYSSPIP